MSCFLSFLRFGVSGYPTLKFFKFGQPYDYDGPRNAEGLLDVTVFHLLNALLPVALSL